ncbi:mucin-17-like isoform X3 [Eriocheir sinensis]|uniref:mucin-17-like isoform X3 n=1 Tax=Eriocheir sinensis TaxID=95602 RepID=UPI0021C6A139|nr:mucin-17-like isoform X3 [Eriocheir sinensis]
MAGGRSGGGDGGDGVTLACVLEGRASPLTEEETWAFLAATATTVQDALLSVAVVVSSPQGRGMTRLVVCPRGVVLRKCGRVELLPTPSTIHAHCLPPSHERNDGEAVLVFSLGRTLWEAVGEDISQSEQAMVGDRGRGRANPSLRTILAAMTHTHPAERLALVDIFQLLVDRLDTRNILNYTAIVRALHEEARGISFSPFLAPHVCGEGRGRSSSTLDTNTSTSKNRSFAYEPSGSMEDLRTSHLSLSTVRIPENFPHTGSTLGQSLSALNTTQQQSSYKWKQIAKETQERSLVREKKSSLSLGSLISIKDNLAPGSISPGSDSCSSSSHHMNPILKTPQERVPGQSSSLEKISGDGEPKPTVTVGRSATVAGDMKGAESWVSGEGGRSQRKRIAPKKPPRSRAMSVDNLLNAETEKQRSLCDTTPRKRRLVMRTPSRLYHITDQQSQGSGSWEVPKTPHIIGPEFVVRSKDPPRITSLLHDTQACVVKRVTVVLVAGNKIEVVCDPASTRVSHIFQAVQRTETLHLAEHLGLAVLGSGEFHFVAPQTKLHKVAPPGWKERHPTKDGLMQDNFTLHLRFMWYSRFDNVELMENTSRHLLYLQLRHDLLEGRQLLLSDTLLQLAALALQAEFGDRKYQTVSYFLPEHYVPESLLRGGQVAEVVEELQQRHSALNGLPYTIAQCRFISTLQATLYYGTHFYHVTQDKGRQQCWLGVGGRGLLLIPVGHFGPESLARAVLHPWDIIKRLSYATHRLNIVLRGSRPRKIKFNLQENRSRHVFYLATVHQNLYQALSSSVATQQHDCHTGAPSNPSSTATTARTSLSSTDTLEDLVDSGPCLEVSGAAENASVAQNVCLSPTGERGVTYPVWPMGSSSEQKRSSESLSRENFLSDILWCPGGDEADEVFAVENFENDQHQKLRRVAAAIGTTSITETEANKVKEKTKSDDKKTGVEAEGARKISPPRVFHQRSKSNVEDGSHWLAHNNTSGSGVRPELTREFGSDESLLASPTKGSSGVRMGTRVSAAALQKRRQHQHLLSHHLPSLQELNTTPTAVVVEPSLRSIVVEESVDESLVERFLLCPSSWSPCGAACMERRLASVTLHKKDGSLGVMIAEGTDHGLYIQAVSPGGPAHQQGSLKPGDRVVGINGRSVENLPYSVAVDLLRQIPEKVTLLVSQPVISAATDSTTATPSSTPQPHPSSHSIESEVTTVNLETSSSQSQSTPITYQATRQTISPQLDPTISKFDLSRTDPVSVLNLTSCQESTTRSNFFSQVDSALGTYTASQTDLSSRAGLTRSDSTYRAEVLLTDSTPVSDSTPTESTTPRAGSPRDSKDSPPIIKSSKGQQAQVRAIGGVTFTQEVTSGPITVITLNTTSNTAHPSDTLSSTASLATTAPILDHSLTPAPSSAPTSPPCCISAGSPSTSRTLGLMTETASHLSLDNVTSPSPPLKHVSTTPTTTTSLQMTEASVSTVMSSTQPLEVSSLGKSEATPQPAPRHSLVWSRSLPEDTSPTAVPGRICSTHPVHSINNNTCSSGDSLSSYHTCASLHRPTRPTIQDCVAAPRWSRALGGPVSSSMETGDHASWSSCTSSLAPCHGSVESLPSRNSMVGTPQPPRLPKDTMLDRVLRCLGAGQVAWTSDHLPQKTLQNLEGHCLEMQLSTDALQPDLFQRSFSLEEETFPVDKSGAVSSASVITPTSPPTLLPTSPTALSPNHLSNILSSSLPAPSSVLPSAPPCTLSSDQLTTLSSSSPSVLPSNSTPTPFHVSFSTPSCKPQGTDQVKQENPTEMIITPPKEFQEEGKSSGTSSPPDTLIPGSFRLITEQEYHRNIRGSKSLAQEVKSGGSGNIIPECSLTNLEHPARSAYLRLLLSQPPPEPPPPVPVSVKKSVISGTEEAVTRSNTPTSHYYHNPVSLEQHSSGQPVVSSTAGHIVFSTTMSTVPSVTTTTTTTTRESVRSSTLNKEDTKSSSGEAHEKETPGSLLSRRRHTGGGCLTSLHLNTLCSEGTHREVSIEVLGEDVGSEDVVSGDVSSNSASSSPPPVNFTTHPLTPDLQFSDSFTSGPLSSYPMAPDPIITATFASDTLLSDSQAVDPMPQDSHITTGDSHILSSTHEDLVPSLAPFANTRTARPHTPDSGSPKRLSFVSSITEFDKTTRMKKHSETQLSTIVPWYDDPRILSKRSDARPPLHKMYPDSDSDDSSNSSNSSSPREKNRVSLSSGKSEESLDLFINNPEPLVLHRVNLGRDGSVNPDGDKDSLISCQADVGDGWGVDAGPTIPQSLLNIGDEEFEQLVGKIVTEQPTSGSNLFSSVSHGVDADDMVKVTRSTSPTRKASFTSKGSSGTNKILPSAIKTHSVTTTIINKNNTMSSHKEHFITESTTKSPSPPGLSTTTISIITTTTSDTKHSVSAPKYTPISKDTSSAFTKNTFIRSFSGSSMEDPGTSEVHRHPNNFNEAPAPSGKVPTGTTSALFQPTTRIVSIVSKSSSDLSTDSPTTLEQAHAGIVAYPQSSSYSSEENPAIPKWSPILPEKNPLYIGNVSGSRRWSPVSPPKSKSQSSPEKSLVNPIWSPIHLPKTCFSPEKTVDNPKCAFSSTEKASNANSLGPNSPEKPSTIEDCPVLKNFDYYNNGQTFNKQASASPVKDPATSEIPSVATGSTVSSEKVPIAPRGYQILPENTSRIPPWVPVSPKKVSYDTQSGSPAKISTSGARGYRSAALKESSISNVIHPDIAKHMPIITKVFPPITTIARNYTSTPVTTTTTTITFPTTSTKKCTSTPIITATIAKTITSDKMFSDSAKIIPATPKFYTATTAYIPAVSTFCEDSTTEDDDQATNTTSTITTTALIGEEKVCTTSKNDFPTITASTFTLKDNLVTTNTTNTAPNADATVKDFLPRNVSKYVHGITSMSINITPSNKHDTPSMVTTTTSKDDDPATSLHTTPSSALYCASTKYIPAARSVPVPARYTVRSALHLPRASSQPDLSTSSSDHQSKMCRPGVPSPTSVSSVNIVPWRSTSLCGINSNPLTHHKEHGKGRLQLRHHSANAVHHLGFYSAKIDSQPKYEQDSSATSKRPQWAAIGSQTKGSPRAGGVVCYRSTVSLNPQTHSPSNNNLASQILPSASRGSANLSPDAEAAQSLHTQKRPQQSPTVCAQGSFTSSSGPVPCQFPRELKTFTSSLSPASPSLFPKGCHQGTTVVGTFNFQDRSEMPSLLASGEPLSSLSNGSQSGEEEGPTLLATFNFLGSPHPAPPMASRKAPAEGLSSLTDSFTSLEDGKHLLAVFDFTKPGTQRPPPPLALRPPPTNTQRPKVTTTKKSDHPHVQGRATTASQKSTLASPNKHVQSPRQKLASSSQQKSSFAHPKSPTAANSQKFASPHVPKSVPAAPQKSASFASAKHVPAAPQKSKFVSEQSGCPAKQSLSPSTLESQRARSSAQRNGSLPTTPCQFQPPTKQQTSTPTQPDMSPLHANSSTNRECDGRKVDMEGSSGTPYHIIDRETTPNDSERKGQESSHKKLATGCDSKAGNGEDLTRIDDHFLSVELLCMEDQRQREEEVEEESDHAVPLASVSKQSSLDSISQFVSRQFADWDACSPALSLIQSGEFWSTDRPFSPVAGASTHTPEGKRL